VQLAGGSHAAEHTLFREGQAVLTRLKIQ